MLKFNDNNFCQSVIIICVALNKNYANYNSLTNLTYQKFAKTYLLIGWNNQYITTMLTLIRHEINCYRTCKNYKKTCRP